MAGVSTLAFAAASPSSSAAVAADEAPSFAVEDYNYPNAAQILADKGILLKRGDGHIVLAECDQSANQIRVLTVADQSAGRDGTYCFRATATTGYLTLELPRVFALETSDRPISADLTANGTTTTVNVPEDTFESVGEGTVGGARSVLVEIRVTG
ncbi:hypothetical protein [Streptomyces sp. TRM72054]|uniref:hypothetical protein n=1 Tax=Streptomyces sp. TRM72054 TaxID=2870562 RepID=UPI0027E16B5D|nr:hypothetical protein [Streptomyces sp. TRM72054]